jgi:hypothetical protein
MSLLKKFLLGIIVIAVLAFTAKEVFYKKEKVVVKEQTSFKFYYYPQLNTYYDFAANNFYYTVDGGETWIVKKPTESNTPESLGEKVTLYSQSPEVWKDNPFHLQQYNGTLINYAKQDVVVAEPIAADTTQLNTQEKEPEVKGKFLKKFRQKIKKRFQKDDSGH